MKKEPAVGIARGGFEVVTNELWDCECFRGEWWLSLVPPDLVPPDPAPEGDLFPPPLDKVRSLEERGGGVRDENTHTPHTHKHWSVKGVQLKKMRHICSQTALF